MVDTRSGDAASAPEVSAVRRRFLMTVMIGSVVWGGAMSVPAQLGWVPLGQPQADNNLAFFAVTCALLLVVWRRPTSFMPVATIYLCVAFAYISAAQFNVHADSLRMLLFFPAVGAIFLILGGLAAWIAIVAALAVFAAAVMTGDMPATPLSASTFALTLFFTGLFFHAFSAQAIDALRTISAQNAALDAAARQDHLTHLLNLRAFRETMQRHVAHADGSAGLCVAFVDVDHFKAINDRHGHAGGDAVLVALSRTLTAAVRPQDVVARIGGEEFAILLPRTGVAEALPIVEGVGRRWRPCGCRWVRRRWRSRSPSASKPGARRRAPSTRCSRPPMPPCIWPRMPGAIAWRWASGHAPPPVLERPNPAEARVRPPASRASCARRCRPVGRRRAGGRRRR